jgi:hypothetical protein
LPLKRYELYYKKERNFHANISQSRSFLYGIHIYNILLAFILRELLKKKHWNVREGEFERSIDNLYARIGSLACFGYL